MKMKSLASAALFLLSSTLIAQPVRTVKSKLQKATVYLQGAHLFYNETLHLLPGNNEIIFENISPQINATSLQANSKNGIVMDVKHNIKYREKPVVTRKYDRAIQLVTDSLEEIEFELRNIENKLRVLSTEKNMLLNNRLIKGDATKDSLALLRDGMNFLREKLNNIYDLELKWDRAKSKAGKTKQRLNERYQELLQLQNGEDIDPESAQPVHQVMVTIYSESPVSTPVSFNYFIHGASWVPLYDLQASSSTNAFQLKYFANVTQSSGIDWKGVPLTLSTSNPNENNTKPQLPPWYLSFIDYRKKAQITYGYESNGALSNARVPMQKESIALSDRAVTEDRSDKSLMTDFVTISESLIRTEYEIKLNYNINSDGLPHKVMINQRDVPMQLQFAAVPKISTDAFLMGNVTGWEDMNIIPGGARLYFDGTYIGEMYLQANSTTDTLSVNLGRDKTIALTRKKIKEKCKVRMMDNDKVETRTIELMVRNTKNIPIEIVLEDQIPITQFPDEIKIQLIDGDGAELDEPTGMLKWKLKLGSKESKKIVFTYEIRHPKNKVLAGL